MQKLKDWLKCSAYAMVAFIASDFAINNPIYNEEYLFKLLIVFWLYLIMFCIYFEFKEKEI